MQHICSVSFSHIICTHTSFRKCEVWTNPCKFVISSSSRFVWVFHRSVVGFLTQTCKYSCRLCKRDRRTWLTKIKKQRGNRSCTAVAGFCFQRGAILHSHISAQRWWQRASNAVKCSNICVYFCACRCLRSFGMCWSGTDPWQCSLADFSSCENPSRLTFYLLLSPKLCSRNANEPEEVMTAFPGGLKPVCDSHSLFLCVSEDYILHTFVKCQK